MVAAPLAAMAMMRAGVDADADRTDVDASADDVGAVEHRAEQG